MIRYEVSPQKKKIFKFFAFPFLTLRYFRKFAYYDHLTFKWLRLGQVNNSSGSFFVCFYLEDRNI